MKRRNEEISKIGGDDDPYFCPEELSIQNSPEVSITKAGDDGQGVKKLRFLKMTKMSFSIEIEKNTLGTQYSIYYRFGKSIRC